MQVSTINNTAAANTEAAAAASTVKVVPMSYSQAVNLNAGAIVRINDREGIADGNYRLVRLHAEKVAEIDGKKLHFAVLTDENDDSVVITLSPADVIELFNGASDTGEFVSDLTLPALPASATKKPKADKAAKIPAPTKRNFAEAIFMDMHTLARLTGIAAPRPVDISNVLVDELQQQKSGASTYYRQVAMNQHILTPDMWKASEARVQEQLDNAEDKATVTWATVGKNARLAVMADFAAKASGGEQKAEAAEPTTEVPQAAASEETEEPTADTTNVDDSGDEEALV